MNDQARNGGGKSEALVVGGLWRPRSEGRVVASGDLDLEKLRAAVNGLSQGGRKLRFVVLDNARAQEENPKRPDLLLMVAPDRPLEARGAGVTAPVTTGGQSPAPARPARSIRPVLGATRGF